MRASRLLQLRQQIERPPRRRDPANPLRESLRLEERADVERRPVPARQRGGHPRPPRAAPPAKPARLRPLRVLDLLREAGRDPDALLPERRRDVVRARVAVRGEVGADGVGLAPALPSIHSAQRGAFDPSTELPAPLARGWKERRPRRAFGVRWGIENPTEVLETS